MRLRLSSILVLVPGWLRRWRPLPGGKRQIERRQGLERIPSQERREALRRAAEQLRSRRRWGRA